MHASEGLPFHLNLEFSHGPSRFFLVKENANHNFEKELDIKHSINH